MYDKYGNYHYGSSLISEVFEEFVEAVIAAEEAQEVQETKYPVDIFYNKNLVVIAVAGVKIYTFYGSHAKFAEIKDFAEANEKATEITQSGVDYLENSSSIKKAIATWSNGRLTITDNTVVFDGDDVPESLEIHLLNLFNDGGVVDADTFTAWTNFIIKLRDASNTKVYGRLHDFLKHNDLKIDLDGDVLAYKVVRPDYKDKHSGTFDNSVGQTPSVPRIKVDDDDNKFCSYGLHVCAFGYLKDFSGNGDPVMLVKVDVRDIISVPADYDGEKVRCCKYTVVKELGKWGVDINAKTTFN